MKLRVMSIVFCATFAGLSVNVNAQKVQQWITNTDKSVLFQKQKNAESFEKTTKSELPVIQIDEKQTYQTVDGFGFALTGGSAYHIKKMSADARKALLLELFSDKGNNIAASYLRISVGASDLNDHAFTYDDMPQGEVDMELKHFDFGPDRNDVIPVLKEIIAINPKIKIMASPWTAPTWMKTNNDTRGGSLKAEYQDVYARYLVRFIAEMKKEGIRIDALTVQNEPLHPGNNPSMLMLAEQQADFVKNNLGPAFKAAKIDTKIVIYDHNADRPDYPISILNDSVARKYIDGSAFHLYGGKIEALTDVHNAHPDKNLYFTEQWVGAPGNFASDIPEHVNNLIIGAMRNWCKTVIEWNLAADPKSNPHTDRGGCDRCLGAVTIDGDKVERNPAYYIVAHASKFVVPGSVRIGSNTSEKLANVAFKTPEGKLVLIVMNNGNEAQQFVIRSNNKDCVVKLNAGAVGSYIW